MPGLDFFAEEARVGPRRQGLSSPISLLLKLCLSSLSSAEMYIS